MQKTFSGAALFGVVLLCSSAVRAQGAGSGVETHAKKMDAALDGLKKTLSCGSAEAVSAAGEGVFSAAGDFGKAVADDSAVVKPGPSPKPKPSAKLVSISDEKSTCYIECREVCTNDHACHQVCHMVCE